MRHLLAPAFVTTLSAAVTVASTACSKKPIGDSNTRNPPALDDPTDKVDASPALTTQDGGVTSAKWGTHKKRKRTKDAAAGVAGKMKRDGARATNPHYPALNPKDTQGRLVFAALDDSCWVKLPPQQPPRGVTGMTATEKEEVDCPLGMDDAAWDECDSTMLIDEKTQKCFCFANFGNPPPPEYVVTCPANANEILKKRADP